MRSRSACVPSAPMRSTVALLAALLAPGCLSGFSEIRVVGPDAGAVDRAPPADRAPGADVVPDDAPTGIDAAPPIDLGTRDAAEADVVDAAGPDVAEDRPELLDVQGADVVDAGPIVDAASTPDALSEDAGACRGKCTLGEVCEGGRCGRWVYQGETSTDATAYRESQDAVLVMGRLDAACAAAFAGSRLCFAREVSQTTADELCARSDRSIFVGDRTLAHPRLGQEFVVGCLVCFPTGAEIGGSGCRVTSNRLACCAFESR